jgi:hypothetical protein
MREKSSLLLFGQTEWLSVSSELGWRPVPPSCRRRLFLSIAFLVSVQPASAQSLRQALEPKLARLSANSRSAVLLWDLPRSESLVAVREEVFTGRRCLGSLVKPFLLLAYLIEHCSDLPSHPLEAPPCPRKGDPSDSQMSGGVSLEFRPCVGRATLESPVECWYKPGHGKLEMSRALAVSCNPYFYQLSKQTPPAAFFRTLATLGMGVSRALAGAKPIPPETMMGLDSNLKLVPLQVLKAYAALISGGPPAETEGFAFARSIVLNGLRLGAVEGTSALAQQALPPNHHLLGKTGTSPALAGGRYLKSRTDGWFLGFYPAVQPVLAVMVYYPGGLGAKDAAPLGGQAIRMYLEMVR